MLYVAVMDEEQWTQELSHATTDLLKLVLANVLLHSWAAYQHPGASVRRISHTTPTGLVGTALDQVVLPVFVFMAWDRFMIGVMD